MTDIGITSVHMDLGAGRRGASAGPAAIFRAGVVPALQAMGHSVFAQGEILQDDRASLGADPRARYLDAITSACARLAALVESSLSAGRFPLVLGGDHSQAIGSVTGLVRHFRPQGKELGVLWVDAHADMNTPETTPSGNLHGMPLAILLGHGLGHGPDALALLDDGRAVLSPEHVVLFGVREVDAEEEPLVRQSGVRVFTRSEIGRRGVLTCLDEALERLSGAGAGIHLSYDLDACDPELAPGVTTPVSRGLDHGEALVVCQTLAQSGRLASMEVVELNPAEDIGNRTSELAVRLVQSALGVPSGLGALRRELERQLPTLSRDGQIPMLARYLHHQMRAQGLAPRDIVGVASSLLHELIVHLKDPANPPCSLASEPENRLAQERL